MKKLKNTSMASSCRRNTYQSHAFKRTMKKQKAAHRAIQFLFNQESRCSRPPHPQLVILSGSEGPMHSLGAGKIHRSFASLRMTELLRSSGVTSPLQYFLGRGGISVASTGSNSNFGSFPPVPWTTPAMSDCENNDL